MSLKGLKEKFIEKRITNVLKNRETHYNSNKIEHLGIIINADEIADFEFLKTLTETLNLRPNKLKIIAFTQSHKESEYSWDDCFSAKDFSWNGEIKNAELQIFIDAKFDLLISYYVTDVIELKYLTAETKASLKVGIFQGDNRINDLIIKTDLDNFDVFTIELKKYLNVLNKINKI